MNVAIANASSDPVRIPTRLEAFTRALRALRVLSRDPNQLDHILEFFFAVNSRSMSKNLGPIIDSPGWQSLLRDRPRIDDEHIDFAALEALPEGTLGRAYATFLKENGITPAPFKTAPNVCDDRLSYVMLRFRQTHDLWHVVTGFRTDVDGEVMLQAFTFAQTRSPASFLIALFGFMRFALDPRAFSRVRAAYELGKKLPPLGPTRWEEMFERPLAEVRARIGAEPGVLPVPSAAA